MLSAIPRGRASCWAGENVMGAGAAEANVTYIGAQIALKVIAVSQKVLTLLLLAALARLLYVNLGLYGYALVLYVIDRQLMYPSWEYVMHLDHDWRLAWRTWPWRWPFTTWVRASRRAELIYGAHNRPNRHT